MDNWNYPYKPKWLGSVWEDSIFERHVFWNPDTQKWAVRPSDGDIVAQFDDRRAAIDHAYELATKIDDDWCDIVIFDENGNEADLIDPEENLELSDKTKSILHAHIEGKLEFVEYRPAKDVIEDVEKRTIHHRDVPPSS